MEPSGNLVVRVIPFPGNGSIGTSRVTGNGRRSRDSMVELETRDNTCDSLLLVQDEPHLEAKGKKATIMERWLFL